MTYQVNENDFLEHHGILGMKWGVRNGPPYPLGSDVSTGHRLRKDSAKGRIKSSKARSSGERRSSDSGYSSKGKLQLTDKQKKALAVGVGVTAGILGAGLYLKTTGRGAAIASQISGKTVRQFEVQARRAGEKDTNKFLMATLPKNVATAPEQCVKSVNSQLRHAVEARRQNNCMLCTTAYDLRRRGFDVTAGNSTIGYFPSNLREWYTGVTVETIPVPKFIALSRPHANLNNSVIAQSIEKQIVRTQGEGARGNFMVNWAAGGGHSMAYEVRGGKLHIMDGQVAKEQDLSKLLSRMTGDIQIARLDTATPRLDYMLENGLVQVKGIKSQKLEKALRPKDSTQVRNLEDYLNDASIVSTEAVLGSLGAVAVKKQIDKKKYIDSKLNK